MSDFKERRGVRSLQQIKECQRAYLQHNYSALASTEIEVDLPLEKGGTSLFKIKTEKIYSKIYM